MIIGILKLEIVMPSMNTIKEKRNRLRSIKDIVRKNFNVAVSDITEGDNMGLTSELAIISVSTDQIYLQTIFSNLLNLIENHHSDIVSNHKLEFLYYE